MADQAEHEGDQTHDPEADRQHLELVDLETTQTDQQVREALAHPGQAKHHRSNSVLQDHSRLALSVLTTDQTVLLVSLLVAALHLVKMT